MRRIVFRRNHMFKIDLIVWKFKRFEDDEVVFEEFKIDLIVWK